MGSVVSITTTRKKIYLKEYKREKLVKKDQNVYVGSTFAHEFMLKLIQNQKINKIEGLK